jgi:ParB-like chromosome segregation protein Spo0J
MSFNIDIKKIKPHPRNKEIYGEENINELAEQIIKSNWINPILINDDNIIISGHRRYLACLIIGLLEIPCERITFKDKNDELERLLLENQYREKTIYQKMKESEVWQEIEPELAKKRRLANLKQNSDKDNCPIRQDGQVRDIIAEKVGLGSGRTYERAMPAVKKIDELKSQGKEKDAEFLTVVLNGSVRGAKDLSEIESFDEISNEIKEKVINKEIPVINAVKQIRNDLGIITDNKKQTIKKNSEKIKKTKICNKCGEEKSILEFYEGKNYCRDCQNSNRTRQFKDVHGNIIPTDKEKLKGIDLDAIEADIKDTNKSVKNNDYDTITMEIQANISIFMNSIRRIVESEDSYEEMDICNKNKLLDAINMVEDTINIIKNKLI